MMNEIIIAFIIGLIEGLTEFLPVSSTGHIILANKIFNFTGNKAKVFDVIIQLGAIFSIVILFRQQLLKIIGISSKKETSPYQYHIQYPHIILGISPIVVIGLVCYKQIQQIFSLYYVIYGLIAGCFFFFISECLKPKQPIALKINDINCLQAFLIGCFQCLSLFPGFSRSGATIAGGILIGVSRKASSEFSFILAVPIIFGASILEIYKNAALFTKQDIPIFIVGFITAFLTALIVIRLFINIIQKTSLFPFIIYRVVLAIYAYSWL
ncbi:undecaprenyl-diphosphate phosphatase [Candidatus Schneideria nysicola]|nr:undecaprenyl-diphosphate phosphatase [Candidatus Schneideria nysicola]